MRCRYCGTETARPDGPSEGYMLEGHLMMECREIPKLAREWYNKPWVRHNLRHRLFMRLHRRWPLGLIFTVGRFGRRRGGEAR